MNRNALLLRLLAVLLLGLCAPLSAQTDPDAAPTADQIDTAEHEEEEVSDETIQAILEALEGDGDIMDSLEATAASGGGGEVFSMLQVVSWIVSRIDFSAEAQAQEPMITDGASARGAGASIIEGLPAHQILIAKARLYRDQSVEALAGSYRESMDLLHRSVAERVEGGFTFPAELDVARGAVIQAQLEQHEAAFSRRLSQDDYEEVAGERLSTASRTCFNYTAASTAADAQRRVPQALQSGARRYWRQLQFADETLLLLGELEDIVDGYSRAYWDHFDLGQRNLDQLLATLQTRFQVQVRRQLREYDRVSAQAWLLFAEQQRDPRMAVNSVPCES